MILLQFLFLLRDIRYFTPENLAATLPRIDALEQIVPAGMNLPELALRHILQHPAVTTVIPGMRKAGHVAQNLAANNYGASQSLAAYGTPIVVPYLKFRMPTPESGQTLIGAARPSPLAHLSATRQECPA